MKTILAVFIMLLVLCSAGNAATKVAVIYSSWGSGAFKNEFDTPVNNLGWTIEKFENTKLADLSSRLSEFEVVILASTGNIENSQNLGPFKQQWLDYLNKGGIFLAVDANYDTVTSMMINQLGSGFELTVAGCAPYTKKADGSAKVIFDKDSALLSIPFDIRNGLINESGIWSHFETWPAGWVNVATCADNKSLFLYKKVGRGLIAATSYASLQGLGSVELAEQLLTNLVTFTKTSATGVKLVSCKFPGPTPGKQAGKMEVYNNSKSAKKISIKLSAVPQDAVKLVQPVSVSVKPGKSVAVPFTVNFLKRGPVALTVEVLADGKSTIIIPRQLVVPVLMDAKVASRHLFDASSVTVNTVLTPEAGKPLAQSVLKISIDNKLVNTVKAPKANASYNLKIAGLGYGLHKATVLLSYKDKEQASKQLEFVMNPQARIHSREDGTLMIDGKPEFPFGWYHVSWATTLQDRLDFIKTIGDAGFNVAHASCSDPDDWQAVLDQGKESGVRIITEYGGDYPALIKKYKDHWAVMAWNPGDEPDGAGISPEEMLRRSNSFRDIDPDHPAYMVLCVPPTYAKYVASADIIAPDIYPIPHGNVGDVYNFLNDARIEAAKYSRPIWAVVQCFGYEDPNSWRVPTVDECRNMTYQSLLAGAKGVIYYTYYDGQFDIRKFPELWQGMKDLVPEIDAAKPYIMSGTVKQLKTDTVGLLAGEWTMGSKRMLIVANTSDKAGVDVKLAIPEAATNSWKPLVVRDSSTLSVSGNNLTGTLRPLGVAVFEY